MKHDYDVLVIGLGPAGMAVSMMAHKLGLKVCAIEKRKIGGECLNVGCIPSKALLKIAKLRHDVMRFSEFGLAEMPQPLPVDPFGHVREVVRKVNEGKTTKMFDVIDLILAKGAARFLNPHTVEVPGERTVTAKRIFICTGTRPLIPAIEGIDQVPYLTNETLYDLEKVPESLLVIGGGAIGCEMGQAIARLGAKVTILNSASCLLPKGDKEAGALLCESFQKEGIAVFNDVQVIKAAQTPGGVSLTLGSGETFEAEKLLVAAGRKIALDGLALDKAGVEYEERTGVQVDDYLCTTQKHIFAVGDCNGYRLFTHAAMHQGMLALINSLFPWPVRRKYKNYIVPWSVFTDPEVSQVGATEEELAAQGVSHEVIRTSYQDYGRTTAEGAEEGFIKALCSKSGRVYGVTLVGQESSEMLHEFALAIQQKLRLSSILFLQHSFPTFSFMNKRIAEEWMIRRIQNKILRSVIRLFV